MNGIHGFLSTYLESSDFSALTYKLFPELLWAIHESLIRQKRSTFEIRLTRSSSREPVGRRWDRVPSTFCPSNFPTRAEAVPRIESHLNKLDATRLGHPSRFSTLTLPTSGRFRPGRKQFHPPRATAPFNSLSWIRKNESILLGLNALPYKLNRKALARVAIQIQTVSRSRKFLNLFIYPHSQFVRRVQLCSPKPEFIVESKTNQKQRVNHSLLFKYLLKYKFYYGYGITQIFC